MTKAITIRLPDHQYELISRLAALTGQSRNAFFQDIVGQAEPFLTDTLAVLDKPKVTPGQRVGEVLGLAVQRMADLSDVLQTASEDLSNPSQPQQAPTL